MTRLSKEVRAHARQSANSAGVWLTGVTGLVADNQDPEKQHRVKVIIPSIDENVVFDEWARQMVFCLGIGYGSAFIPPKGSEVVLFGQLGQKYNLFYASLYNEEMMMPDGYPDENTVGVHAPGNLKFIAELLATMRGQNVEAIAAELAKITGQNIESTAGSENKMSGQTIKLEGATVHIDGNGNISISGGTVAIDGSSVTIRGRTVLPSGPPI
jgi:Type VI secretion system/phage-baseplate injector OB domain